MRRFFFFFSVFWGGGLRSRLGGRRYGRRLCGAPRPVEPRVLVVVGGLAERGDHLAEVRSLGKGVLMGGLGFHRQLIDGPVPCTGCHASGSGKRPVVTSIMYAQFNHNVRGYRYSAKHS